MTAPRAYYNEIDPKAAAWLRELIRQGLIADGEVDERDIQDVTPADIRGFAQCHFFAGIGVWSYALRRAGWPDDRPVWTASCPCQPFSSAGKGAGFDDERHLWPAVDWLVQQCEPECIIGEQVASKDAEPWLDLVQADLEGLGYAFGACAFPSSSIGAPHIRDRSYWVADTLRDGARHNARTGLGAQAAFDGKDGDLSRQRLRAGREGSSGGLAHASGARSAEQRRGRHESEGFAETSLLVELADANMQRQRPADYPTRPGDVARACEASRLADAGSFGRGEGGHGHHGRDDGPQLDPDGSNDGLAGHADPHGARDEREHGLREVASHAGPVNGGWGNADWIYCRNGEWRPVEPGTFPLAHGAAARVGRLRGYGNAINAEAATAFVQSYLEITT